MLHIINKSPFENTSFASCLQHALPNSNILLIEDAVLAAVANTACEKNIAHGIQQHISFYALKPDIEARGILDKITSHVQLIDYAEFVELTIKHHPIQTWL